MIILILPALIVSNNRCSTVIFALVTTGFIVTNHYCLFQLVELSKAQDIEAGDGTTSVVIVAGALLEAAEKLLQKGIHPTTISDAFQRAAAKAVEILGCMAMPVQLNDRDSLIQSASTSLNSKVV